MGTVQFSRNAQKGGRTAESANGGGSGGPPKTWRTRLGLVAGAVGVMCIGLMGCREAHERRGWRNDDSAERYNGASEMWRNHGRMDALSDRVRRDRERVDGLEKKLKGEKDGAEKQRLRGMISAIRDGIDEMNREIAGLEREAGKTGKIPRASGEENGGVFEPK